MSKVKYTVPQKRAVFYGDGDLLLSAAAGSGKTASLTGRIVELIVSGRADISQMLIVTFTRAAAAEMKTRIRSALRDILSGSVNDSPAVRGRASRALSGISGADISTIDSFLYKSLKEYFPLLGLSADFRIADQKTIEAMKKTVMRSVVDGFFAAEDDGDSHTASFSALCDVIAQVKEADSADGTLLWLAEKLTDSGEDENALLKYAAALDSLAERGDIMSSPYGRMIRERFTSFRECYTRIFDSFAAEFEEYPKIAEKYGNTLAYIRDWLGELSENADYMKIRSALAGFSLPRLGVLRGNDVCEVSLSFKYFKDEIKRDAAYLYSALFSGTPEEAASSAAKNAALLRCAAGVIGEYYKKLDKKKKLSFLLDYSDLTALATRLFIDEKGEPTEAARTVGERYKYIFIDEYQDTNRVQDNIFKAISSHSVRFMVGDIKQSIYRFRGADPSVFSEYRKNWEVLDPYSDDGEENPGGSTEENASDSGRVLRPRSLFMSENFRCDEPVIRFVNAVSSYIMPCGTTPYTSDDDLIYAKNGGESDICENSEVILIEKPIARKKKNDGIKAFRKADDSGGAAVSADAAPSVEDAEDTDVTEFDDPEAAYVARRIKSMIGRYFADGKNIIRAKDIAVLLRSPSSYAAAYERELESLGIAVKMKNSKPLVSYSSVMLLMCLMGCVDNPLCDIPTAGALRSPLFGFTSGEIIKLRGYAGDSPIYMAAADVAEGCGCAPNVPNADDKELRKKCEAFTDFVRRHKTVSRGMSVERYLEYLLRDADIFSLPGIRASGEQRDAINRLCSMAHDYSAGAKTSGYGDISGFISYVNETASEGEGGSAELGDEDAVTIMSIHASKGLEFPICFISECDKKRITKDEDAAILFDPDIGFGMTLTDEEGLVKYENLIRRAVSEKIKRDSVSEEMRMLYVAMTRAKNKLIIVAKSSNCEKLIKECEYKSDFALEWPVCESESYIEWIISALAREGVVRDGVSHGGFADLCIIRAEDISGVEAYRDVKVSRDADASGEEYENGKDDSEIVTDGNEASIKSIDILTPEEIKKRFSFEYPYEYLRGIPAKLVVSRLYPEILDESDDIPREDSAFPLGLELYGASADSAERTYSADIIERTENAENSEDGERGDTSDNAANGGSRLPMPRFMTGENSVKAVDRGTATHRFMQFADFSNLLKNGVRAELERLIERKFISRKGADEVNLKQLERFAQSSLLRRMEASPMVRREFRFNALFDADRFTANEELRKKLAADGVKLTVQGVVDCVFRDPDTGGLVLVDYKTDAIYPEEWRNIKKAEERLIRRHRDQLMYYREVCSRMFSEDIRTVLIYSTPLGKCIRVGE